MLGTDASSSIDAGLDQLAKHARTVLVAIAAINLGGAGLLYATGAATTLTAVAPQIATGALFVVLAVWARRSPMVPVAVGSGLYFLSLAATIIATPAVVLSMWGLILHGILVILCINGLGSARSYRDLQRRFKPQG